MPLMIVRPNDSAHFRDRLFTRYGLLISPGEVWDLRKLEKLSLHPDPSDPTGTNWICYMVIKGKVTKLVWNRMKDMFVTALVLRGKDRNLLAEKHKIYV